MKAMNLTKTTSVIINNISIFLQNDVNDCHFAINFTLNAHPELDLHRIVLMGHGFGATLAVHLGLKYGYGHTILINPISDLGAMSSSLDLAEWPYHVMGVNYSSSSVPTDILTSTWNL